MLSDSSIMLSILILVIVFFFKQKTAYEMRISDWSSDVCSSDLSKVLEAHYAVWKVAGGDRSTDGGAAPCHSGGGHRTPVHRGIQRSQGAWHLRGHRLKRASLRVVRQV